MLLECEDYKNLQESSGDLRLIKSTVNVFVNPKQECMRNNNFKAVRRVIIAGKMVENLVEAVAGGKISKSSELINTWKRNMRALPGLQALSSFFPQQLVHFLLSCLCIYVQPQLSGGFSLPKLLRGKFGGSNKMSLCYILKGQKRTARVL